MDIYLIRHTEPDVKKSTCYGQSDVGILASFTNEAESVKKKFEISEDAVFYSSPLTRCKLLAESLCPKEKIKFDNRIMEINFGDWELKAWDDFNEEIFAKWSDNIVDYKIPGGESFRDLYERSIVFLNEIFETNHPQVAIVTHAGVIRACIVYILGMPLENLFRIHLDFGSISKLNIEDKKIKIIYVNK
ncbi:MAG: alpha-ribazole phosphatase [Desulfobacterales bacterium]|nr:alpha-ribazole phosphatase [Desulfobacterales bacterium]